MENLRKVKECQTQSKLYQVAQKSSRTIRFLLRTYTPRPRCTETQMCSFEGRYSLSNVFWGTAAATATNMMFESLRNQDSAARNAIVFVLKTENFWFVPRQYSSASEYIHNMFAACLLTDHTSEHHVLDCRIRLCHGICSIICTSLEVNKNTMRMIRTLWHHWLLVTKIIMYLNGKLD